MEFSKVGHEGGLFSLGDEGVQHVLLLGTSGRGKSVLLEQLAVERGVSVDELARECAPTPEQLVAERQACDIRRQQDLARLQAVRDAYWVRTDHDECEFSSIHDGLVAFCAIEQPTTAQLKVVFDLMPAEVIGNGIRWGFDDTEVRDEVYAFVRDHADTIRGALKQLT